MALVSPGVEVTVSDDSTYVNGTATALPLIVIATADEKFQEDGVTPALGTYENGVLRVVTSLRQSLELYGIPKFYKSASGVAHHGDARNEYGLDALNKLLEVGNRAYVLRANVNLNDDVNSLRDLWESKTATAAELLGELIADYITAYNAANNLFPADANYKESVNAAELKTLVNDALDGVFSSYSFSTDLFAVNFLRDHLVDQAGYQDVIFDVSGGFLQLTDITGLEEDQNYGAQVSITSGAGTSTHDLFFSGDDVVTFGNLIAQINSVLGSDGTCELIAGRIRITSSFEGVSSAVDIVADGPSGYLPLFSNLNLYQRLAAPINGKGGTPLFVYNDDFDTITGTYDGLDALIDNWSSGSIIVDEFTSVEAEGLLLAAAADYDNTAEFRSETALGSNDAARRLEIRRQLQAVVNNPRSGIRAEHLEYNIAVCPGFPELSEEMVRLSGDMFEEVQIIGETPFDKPPTGPNGINTWAVTPARVTSPHIGYYYAHGISSNIDGDDIMTTACSTALRTYAYNDANAEVWFAPAGTSRGRCEHLTSIGYVSGVLGGPTTFVEDFLDIGVRDELYEFPKNINPITFIPGRGILVLGQKTTNGFTSARDRVNVERMIKFIRRSLRKSLFSFLFEPNDSITRKQVKFAVDNFLSDLIGRRALYDFATVCDTSNNTPERIDRNELWCSIALKPVKSVEFIHIPISIARTGADIGSGRTVNINV